MPFAAALVLALPLAFPMAAHAAFDDEAKPAEQAAPADDGLEALPEQVRPMAAQALAKLKQEKDPAKLKAMLAAFDAQAANAPEEMKPMLDFLRGKIQAQLDSVGAEGGDAAPAAETTPAAEATAAPAEGAAPASDAPAMSPANVEAMETFIHAALIARGDLAKGAADALLADGVQPTELALIVDQRGLGDRLDRAVTATRASADVHEAALQLLKKVEAGRDALARDPQRIQATVANLKGTMRQQAEAMRRLEQAGSYAMPALLNALINSGDPQTELLAARAMAAIGRNAVLPLCTALPMLHESQQVRVCQVLSEIGWKAAAPALVALQGDAKASAGAREAAGVALRRMGVTATEAGPMWAMLAKECLVGGEGLVPHAADPVQVTWNYDPQHGLMPGTVPTAAYLDTMAQRFAVKAMQCNAQDGGAMATYLAAGLRLETAGVTTEGLAPSTLVTLAGPAVGREVLSLGLSLQDLAVQRSAIRMLGGMAGANALVQGGASNPLIACLDSASQRVRVEAALALAHAMPSTTFARCDTVVPVLAGALRSAGRPSAAVVAAQSEDRGNFEKWLRDRGFEVVASEADGAALAQAMAGRGSAELVVVAGGPSDINRGARAVRGQAMTGSAMLVLAVQEPDVTAVDRSLRDDRATGVWFLGRGPETFGAVVDDLMKRAGGGAVASDESEVLASQCAQALVAIGAAGGGPFRMVDGEQALVKALSSQGESLRPRIAEALSWVPSQGAQRALLSSALASMASAEGMKDVPMLLRAAAASARRFGDKSDPGQVEQLRKAITALASATGDAAAASADLRAAVAECYGSLNLGPEQAIRQIVK